MEVVSTGDEGAIWKTILGTNRVLVTDQPNAVIDPVTGKTTLVFYADLDRLTPI